VGGKGLELAYILFSRFFGAVFSNGYLPC
jgi:hypothetical protein